MVRFNRLLCVLPIVALSHVRANAQVLADSVTQFSSVQGQNNWYYGYYDKTHDTDKVYNPTSDFQLMTQYEANGGSLRAFSGGPTWYVSDGQVFTSLWADGGHGNGLVTSGNRQMVEEFAIRRWVSDYAGTINLSGTLAKLDPSSASNGIAGYITVNGTTIYAKDIGGQDTTGVNYSLNTTVSVGSVVDFWIDPYMANDLGDSSKFTETITAVSAAPEPATLSLTVVLALPVIFMRRRREVY